MLIYWNTYLLTYLLYHLHFLYRLSFLSHLNFWKSFLWLHTRGVEPLCFLQHGHQTWKSEMPKRRDRHWRGTYTGMLVLIYSMSTPSLPLTASNSDLKQLRYGSLWKLVTHRRADRQNPFHIETIIMWQLQWNKLKLADVIC